MEIYDDTNCYEPAPEPPAVDAPAPAPLPAFEPPAPVAPAPEMTFPAAPPALVAEVPAPVVMPEPQPVVEAPVTSGTLLGPSTVGGSTDTGSWVGGAPDLSAGGFVGGSPDLSSGGFVGGSPELGAGTTIGGPADLGMTWVDDHGTPVSAPDIPVVPGPFNAAAAGIVNSSNAAITNSWLGSGGGGEPYPSSWSPGYDFDKDGVPNERDAKPRDRFS